MSKDEAWRSLWVDPFVRHLAGERRLSQYTARNYETALEVFFRYLDSETRWAGDLKKVDLRLARDFVIEQQRRVSRRTVHNYVSGLRTFFKYWIRQGKLETNPLVGIVLPKLPKKLPAFMTERQVKLLIDGPMRLLENEAIPPFQAWRDRLVMELLYGAGFRVSELCSLTYGQVSFDEGVARIVGKGGKSRICPLGRVAIAVLDKWRREFAVGTAFLDPVVLSNSGKKWNPRGVQLLLKKYLSLAELPMDLTPHKIRHSYATHLLDNGADLRLVQELLGHAKLSTTQIYTHVNISRLKEAFDQAHPRA
ncbi:tyrosine recombinase XerC [Pelagicoccus enzymogenes]|uniref:tyrosine recombinase XerC n=1 Tax=Pelagicoccus enzymogenes TaxID=2773457 RepID=UPI00280EE78F|nr:tyrosine recombinase XerC [Pelagicoccus enzymogenes]MDQ8198531.1 tyrosine recombinase XerC [Pelagicoccus enzymogenes]